MSKGSGLTDLSDDSNEELSNGAPPVTEIPVPILTHRKRRHRRKAIARSFKKGDDVRDICDRFGVSIGTVRYACKENNVPFTENIDNPHTGASLQFPTYRMIGELVTTSSSLVAIAKKYGVTKQWVSLVYGRCKKAGIPVQERRWGRPIKTSQEDAIEKFLVEAWKMDKSEIQKLVDRLTKEV